MLSFGKQALSRSSKSPSGFTTIELLIAMILLGFIGTLIAVFLFRASRASFKSTADSTLLRRAVLIADELGKDFETTTVAGVALHNEEEAFKQVTFHPVAEINDAARLTYSSDRLIVWEWNSDTSVLKRHLFESGSPVPLPTDKPLRLSQAQAVTAVNNSPGPNRIFPGVRSYELLSGDVTVPAPNIVLPLELKLKLVLPSNDLIEFRYSRVYLPIQ